MHLVPLAQTVCAVGVNLASAAIFCGAVRHKKQTRASLLVPLTVAVLASPLLILPRGAGLLRFIIAAMSVQTGFRLYDLHEDPAAPQRPNCLGFVAYQFNPFAIAWRRVWSEHQNHVRKDIVRFLADTSLGALAILLMVLVFHIDWARYPFVLEHCAKAISFLLVIQLLLNGLAAGYRLAGLRATDFAGNFFFSATPAEFWRRYNRPVEQFFEWRIFRPAGGLRHPIRATVAVFLFSAIIHEYIFDIAARQVLGYQLAFFLIHGAAAVMTLRLRPKGTSRVAAIALNCVFNLGTAYLFFMSMNAVVPFYVCRVK